MIENAYTGCLGLLMALDKEYRGSKVVDDTEAPIIGDALFVVIPR